MTRPEDISERAWEAAETAYQEAIYMTTKDEPRNMVLMLARAIDAETERAAMVIEAAAATYLTASIDTLSVAQKMRLDEAHRFLMGLAQAIRSPHV